MTSPCHKSCRPLWHSARPHSEPLFCSLTWRSAGESARAPDASTCGADESRQTQDRERNEARRRRRRALHSSRALTGRSTSRYGPLPIASAPPTTHPRRLQVDCDRVFSFPGLPCRRSVAALAFSSGGLFWLGQTAGKIRRRRTAPGTLASLVSSFCFVRLSSYRYRVFSCARCAPGLGHTPSRPSPGERSGARERRCRSGMKRKKTIDGVVHAPRPSGTSTDSSAGRIT